MNNLKKSTEKVVTRSFSHLERKIDKLSERITLTETNEDQSERVVTVQINRLSDSQAQFKSSLVSMEKMIKNLHNLVQDHVLKTENK